SALRMAVALICAVSAFIARPASATTIDYDTYTTDTATGLDWRGVTGTTDLSYNYISSQFGAGGVFAGWRYASGAELTTFLLDYGIAAVPHDNTPATQLALHQSLINQLGPTYVVGSTMLSLYALIDNGFPSKQVAYFSAFEVPSDHSFSRTFIYPNYLSFTADQHDPIVGSFLVRDSNAVVTPLPAALPLFATGLGVMGLLGW